ncbi:MAG: hypothetical protein JO363_12495 [Solirubrobacterales bacterium]|nr:hypothetical protein [Solirubrobacterales bacterium]
MSYATPSWAQVRDYRTAITYAMTRPEADADRIGIWGTSLSGGARDWSSRRSAGA